VTSPKQDALSGSLSSVSPDATVSILPVSIPNLSKHNVLITGGAGFLARGILRRVYERNDASALPNWQITVYSRDEQKQNETRRRYPHARYILGDVCDTERLTAAAAGHDLVIHAAAVKYIPEAEENPAECVRVNVDGARSVIQASIRAGVETVIGISTDKAVRPLNGYGMTKAIMERLFTEAHYRNYQRTRFQTVRYGNVVGSTGSVIPLFQSQLKRDGFVTLTDPNMTRFWMSIDEAIDTILYAFHGSRIGGSVTIPRPKAMRLGDLAKTLAGEKVKIVGMRPGEKEHEELMHSTESAYVHTPRNMQFYEMISRAFMIPETAQSLGMQQPQTLASHSPAGGMITEVDMFAMIKDAADV
jgi:UDP-N-acetylglucosamine 4,6-dehydratase